MDDRVRGSVTGIGICGAAAGAGRTKCHLCPTERVGYGRAVSGGNFGTGVFWQSIAGTGTGAGDAAQRIRSVSVYIAQIETVEDLHEDYIRPQENGGQTAQCCALTTRKTALDQTAVVLLSWRHTGLPGSRFPLGLPYYLTETEI